MERTPRGRTEMAKEELGDFLRQESRRKGISIRRLSVDSGLSPAAVQQILNRGRATLPSLNKLADYLGVKRQYLWQLAGLMESTETDFTDPRLRSQFAQVDKLPDPARTLAIKLIDSVLTFVEEGRC